MPDSPSNKKKNELELDGEEREFGFRIPFFSYARKKIFKRKPEENKSTIINQKEIEGTIANKQSKGKPLLTISDLLLEYFYKEDVQEMLFELGQNTTGNKDRLVTKLLETYRTRGKDVNTLANELIYRLPVDSLKNYC